MCPHKEYFFTYTSVSSGTITLGDNRTLTVVGVCTIRIKMFDNVIRTLEVRHIPKLRKSLISLSILGMHGYRFSVENEILRVFRGALVMMKGKSIGGLYHLQDNTIMGSANLARSLDDPTQLWHMRLGHRVKQA